MAAVLSIAVLLACCVKGVVCTRPSFWGGLWSSGESWQANNIAAGSGAHGLPDLSSRPIICVLAQPGDLAPPGASYLSAGYVKWLEAAGARVAPVLPDMSTAQITEMFEMCNGVLFPGGNYPLNTETTWFQAGELLHSLAVEANSIGGGQVYPLLGTCLGLQLLTTIVSRDQYALVPLDAHNHPASIMWTEAASSSRLLAHVPDFVRDNLASLPIAMHNHHYGLTDESLELYPALKTAFNVLAHSKDWLNTTYISFIEGTSLPFAGLAFHAEKVPYEWTLDIDVPHTREATDASYHLGAAFVGLARKNNHKGPDVIFEDKRLIYNFHPTFAGKHKNRDDDEEHPFEQVYIFELKSHPAFASSGSQ